ncbi:AAA family ATPase [Herbidospora sp. NEAU-GS84]|uniref:AAA family ATPase n=1 Tax=Herbidospora solisilvae TaxID=2696284 RepID=A0A7C9N4P3_9ACTN|nr:WD40 repeat domain-containing protein [Herbidospora solisilvae]NAS25769.1 AAA family ATPase [Herbidospora solisilvae]
MEFHDNVFTGPVAATVEYHDHQHHHPAPGNAEPAWPDNPYRGLAPFGEHDAEVFYGREQVTAQLAHALATRLDGLGTLLVTGPSGAGKSSLFRAGLLPYLAAGRLPGAPGSGRWPRVVMSPTADPLTELAVHLAALSGADPVEIRRTLLAHPDQSPLLFRQAIVNQLGSPGPETAQQRLVLVVDQFEEIFNLAADPANQNLHPGDPASTSAQAFLSVLRAAAEIPAGPSGQPAGLIVIGVRGDFWDRCAALPTLVDIMRAGPFTVAAMGEPELRRAIIGPAGRAGLRVDDDLVDLVLSDLRALPVSAGPPSPSAAGVLPLLSQAMMMTWQHREGDRLTLRGYGTCGGVAHAVRTSAEAVYGGLTPARQALARQVFRQLTITTPSGELVRRRVTRGELEGGQEDDELAAVVSAFTDQRLMVSDGDGIELAHDVLLAAWPRMADWLNEDHEHRILYGQLLHASEEWRRNADDPSFLYQGSRLTAVRRARVVWQSNPFQFSPLPALCLEFLGACDQAATRVERMAVRSRRIGRVVIAVVCIAALVASVAALRAFASERAATSARVLAEEEGRRAEARRKEALSRLLTLHADRLADTDPITAGLLAAAAWRSAPTPEARHRMLATLATGIRTVLNNPSGEITAMATSPDGTTVAIAAGRIVQLWHVQTRRPVGLPLTHSAPVSGLAFSPDGTTLASSAADGDFGDVHGTVQLWSVKAGRVTVLLHDGDMVPGAVAFSPDGKVVAAVTNSSYSDAGRGAIRLWNARTGRPLGEPLRHGGRVVEMAFSPDGTKLISGTTTDGPQLRSADPVQVASHRMWDVRRRVPIGDLMTDRAEGVAAVAFNPDGTTLVTGGNGGKVQLWNALSLQPISEPIEAHARAIETVAFGKDGRVFATGSADGTIRLWDSTTLQAIGEPLRGHSGPVETVVFGAQGTALASSGDTTVRMWDISVLRPTDVPIRVATPFAEMALSPDATVLAVAGPPAPGDEPVHLWDMRTSRPIGRLKSGAQVSTMVFASDGETLAIGAGESTTLWDTGTRHRIGDPLHVGDRVKTLAFRPGGKALAVISDSVDREALHIWNTGRRSAGVPISPDSAATSVAFSPDGELMITGHSDGTVRFRDPRTGQPIGASNQGHDNAVYAIAFSPDGTMFATGSSDRTTTGSGTTRVWDTRTRQPIGAALPQNEWVTALAFSPDGTILVTGGTDGVIQVWDSGTGRPIGTAMKAHETTIESMAFSRDGATLSTAAGDGTVRTMRVALPAEPIEALCDVAGRSLSIEEWKRYLPDSEPFQAACPQ